MSIALHNAIEKYNVLKKSTQQVGEYLRKHPTFYKTALLADHLFRAVSMVAFSLFLPFSTPISTAICFAGSLFYRLTVETNCAYKFALPAFAGSTAYLIGRPALQDLASGAAFASIGAFALALAALLPLDGYFTYISLTVSYDVDKINK